MVKTAVLVEIRVDSINKGFKGIDKEEIAGTPPLKTSLKHSNKSIKLAFTIILFRWLTRNIF